MNSFWKPNIQGKGRLFRGLFALLLWVLSAVLGDAPGWVRVLLLVGGGVVMFEAVRGWCILRACGVKTRW